MLAKDIKYPRIQDDNSRIFLSFTGPIRVGRSEYFYGPNQQIDQTKCATKKLLDSSSKSCQRSVLLLPLSDEWKETRVA